MGEIGDDQGWVLTQVGRVRKADSPGGMPAAPVTVFCRQQSSGPLSGSCLRAVSSSPEASWGDEGGSLAPEPSTRQGGGGTWHQGSHLINSRPSRSHLAQNPFVCDCHLKWLADYLQDNPIETSGARCSSPRRLANKRIGQIKSKKFRCSGNQLMGQGPTF